MRSYFSRALAGTLAAASLTFFVNVAYAQAENKAAAEALFQKAKDLMAQGRYGDACPAFAESDRLDPGIGTKLRLADCYALTGKSASAWAQFKEAAELAGKDRDPREKIARKKVAELEPTLPKLVIEIADGGSSAGKDALEIRRNGVLVGKATWGIPIPVDPGDYEITATAPGRQSWSKHVSVEARKTATVSVPPLAADERSESRPAEQPATSGPSERPDAPHDEGWGFQRTLGVVAAGAGVVGLAVGGYFGLEAKSKLDESNADGHCRPDNRCDAKGVALRQDFVDAAGVSTIAFVAGGVLLAGGAVLFFTAPKGMKVAPAASAQGGGLVVGGTF